MSKSKTILAGLGVVTALGTAALPLASYAAPNAANVGVSGNVDLYVEVMPAIAMTITGNNDASEHYANTSYKYTVATPEGTEDPSGEGWYEKSGNTYTLSEDTEVNADKTYFSRSANTEGVDVFAPTVVTGIVDSHTEAFKVGPSSSYASLLPNSVLNGNDDNGFKSTIKVYTNNKSGYTLNVKDADSTLALSKITTGEDPTVNATIPAGTESEGSFSLVAGTAAWGYKVDTASADNSGYKAITASDVLVKTKTSKTSNGEETKVYYGVATSSDQAAGVYTDTIIYTATTNN
ncbi:MAG: hypothetical protein Q4E46_02550 [Candidatus Saccharibacteria bacterium]|nr:hypothetical protein [Candidatus Saccharibacteria bacterium]